MPPGVASPKAWVAWLKSAQVAPASDRAVLAAGSTRTPGVLAKSMTKASSQVPKPGALWPPPRTASSIELSRAKLTQAMTSATWDTRTTAAGLLSIMPLKTARAAS